MPLRRRAARLPEHRRARPCRRPVGRGPVRGRGHPGRSGHLLLPRRARVAVVLPVHPRAQHRRAWRPELLHGGRPVPVGPARGRPGDRGHRRWRRRQVDGGAHRLRLARPAGHPPALRAAGQGLAQHRHHRRDRGRRVTTSGWPSTSVREVQVELYESGALLRWETTTGRGKARLELPPGLHWTLHHGETDPIMGWYSSGPGAPGTRLRRDRPGTLRPGHAARHPAGFPRGGRIIRSRGHPAAHIMGRTSNSGPGKAPEVQAEAR